MLRCQCDTCSLMLNYCRLVDMLFYTKDKKYCVNRCDGTFAFICVVITFVSVMLEYRLQYVNCDCVGVI